MLEYIMEFTIMVLVTILFSWVTNHFIEKKRRKKVMMVDDNFVLVLAYGWGDGFRSGLGGKFKIHRSDLEHPESIDHNYSSVVKSGTTAIIKAGDNVLSKELHFDRPPSGILYIKNKYTKYNTYIISILVLLLYVVLLLDIGYPFIDNNQGILLIGIFILYIIYYWFLFRAEYSTEPYIE